MTRSTSPLEKLKHLVRGIVLWRFVRRPVKATHTPEEIRAYTEVVARHDAFWLVEYPMRMAMLSAEISVTRMKADVAKAEAQREQAERNARDFAALMARIPPNHIISDSHENSR